MSAADAALPAQTILRNYVRAKDENRPHLLDHVFDADAELHMVNHASTISFPARTAGREAIADVLVRNFGQTYENIYTFCLRRPAARIKTFSCAWLVAMSEKQSRSVRVGCGRYDWSFGEVAPHLATHLTITIDAMQILPPADLAPVLAWVRELPYPWCGHEEAVRNAPAIDMLAPVLQRLAAQAAGI